MIPPPPRYSRTDTLFPDTSLFRSVRIEAGELDADRARSDHQQLRRQLRRHHRMAIGPDPLPVRLGEGQGARPGTRRDDDVLRFEIDRLIALLDGKLALGGEPALTRDHRDLVLLQNAGHARVELSRTLAAAD